MTVGEKIKKIRTFRGLTQQQLGVAIGLPEKGADNRIAQYETNYRVPKRDLLVKISEVLHVNRQNFFYESPGSLEAFIYQLIWLDEEHRGLFQLFQMRRIPDRYNQDFEYVAYYSDNDDWPTRESIGIYFDSFLVDDFLQELFRRRQELNNEEISYDEYFEWKLNWPYTSDEQTDHNFIPWRKQK